MKGSIKSSRNFMVIMALVLLAMNTQAQLVTCTTTLGDAYVATTNTETIGKTVLTNTGAMIVSKYQEGAAIIKLENKYGLVNKQGYEICQPIYEEIHLFNGGYAAVKKNGKWTFVNKQGKKLTPLRYDWVGGFNDGLAAVLKDGKWGLLNEQGFEVVPTTYNAVKVDQDGRIWVQMNATWKPFDAKKSIDEAFVTAS
ncbi:MAG: Unknown protein [uncultured Aureispira sp.]|uniref:WG repeat-containing protein n=1 Tax=uncultured Aureispira sp. TaxID=1331704 RepID=A0A6S6U7K3_9BACT|nr:MAG: Unknown protein [uncultured Aureispira sp.]